MWVVVRYNWFMIDVQENVNLVSYPTMKLGGNAKYLVIISSEDELIEALEYAENNQLKTHVVGGGSNSIFSSAGYEGLIIINRILAIEEAYEGESLNLVIGAGEDWDGIVELSVNKGYVDIASLSLIPGTVGAAPIQNIGAYGQQVSGSLVSVRAYDKKNKIFVEISNKDCNFTYRSSRFNDRNRFIITSVKLQLSRKTVSPPFYADISKYFSEKGIDENKVSPAQLRQATSEVRVIKLPDPTEVASCGSFFKNPVISRSEYENLLVDYPDLRSHQTDDGKLKLYAGQLIELCGMKDFHNSKTGMATWKNQALVVVNESAETTEDLIEFKKMIVKEVEKNFNIIFFC